MKKIFKKSLAIMVSAAICLTALIGCLSVSAATRGEGTFTVGSDSGKPGESVTVPIELKYTSGGEGMGIAASLFDVSYNTDALTITDIAAGEDATYTPDLGGVPGGEGVPPQDIYTVEYRSNGETISVVDDAVRILAMPAYNETVPADSETVLTSMTVKLTFRIKDGAAAQDYAITITKQQTCDYGQATPNEFGGFTYADDEEFIDMTITNGKITVVEDAPTEPVPDENLKIRSAAIVLENGFALNFNVRTSVIDGTYTDPYIVFKKAIYGSEGTIESYETSTVQFASATLSGENYVFNLSGILPQEIGSNIIATIYGTKDGVLCEGATVEYSVLTFATNQLKSATATQNMKKALADMLYYGAEVQKLSNYNIQNLVTDKATEIIGNDSWTEFVSASIDRELVNSQSNQALEGATVKIRSAALTLEDKVIVNFNCAELDNSIINNAENYILRVVYNNNYGSETTYDIAIDPTTGIASLDKLISTEMSLPITATIIDISTQQAVSNTVTYSIETYIRNNISNPTYGAICEALIKYGDSVKLYAGLD